jgi:hypothetical protein
MKKLILILVLTGCEPPEDEFIKGGCARDGGEIVYVECHRYQENECIYWADGKEWVMGPNTTTNSPEACAFGNELLKNGIDPGHIRGSLG